MAKDDPSRGRHDPDREEPVTLCRDDKRKLYGLLDGDVSNRLKRLEYGMISLLVLNGGQLAAGTNPIQNVTAIVHALL